MATKLKKLCFFDDDEDDDDTEEEEEEENIGEVLGEGGRKVICSNNGRDSIPSEKNKQNGRSCVENGQVDDQLPQTGCKRKLSHVSVEKERTNDVSSKAKSSLPKPHLPLPSALLLTSTTTTTTTTNSSSAAGRVRNFAHVRGNWASHVFLRPFVDDETLEDLGEKIASEATKMFAAKRLPSVKVHALAAEDLHLSLSRTFVLAHHLIQSYVDSLGQALHRGGPSGGKFLLAFSSAVKIYFNDENTRGFIAIQVHPSCAARLRLLVSAVDSTLKDFNLSDKIFYDDPSFHLSLAWFLPPDLSLAGEAKEDSCLGSDSLQSNGCYESSTLSSSSSNQASSSPSVLSPDVILSIERLLSNVVAKHFLQGDDDLSHEPSSSSLSLSSSPPSSSNLVADNSSFSAVDVASSATEIKEVTLKTGNKLHTFRLL